MTRISVGEYVATRLVQVGASRVFGAEDARRSRLIDEICRAGELAWTESSSELGAAYAASGFARAASRPAAVLTDSDIGGLSALVGVADAGAAGAPVVLVAALPDGEDAPLHVSLLERMSIERAVLEPESAAVEIDRVLAAALSAGSPAYLGIPLGVVEAEVDAAPLASPLRWTAGDAGTVTQRRRGPARDQRDVTVDVTVDGAPAIARPVDLDLLWSEISDRLRTGSTIVADRDAYGGEIAGFGGGSEIIGLTPGASPASIVPLALGAALARPDRRILLAIGAQTARPAVDDLGRLLGAAPAPVVVVLDDRPALAGTPDWTWELVPAVLGDRRVRVFSVTTVGELREALDAVAEASRPVLVRVRLLARDAAVGAAA